MDDLSKKHLDLIRVKELSELTPPDITFLRARRSYLSKSELEYFAPVLEEKSPDVKKEEPLKATKKAEKLSEL